MIRHVLTRRAFTRRESSDKLSHRLIANRPSALRSQHSVLFCSFPFVGLRDLDAGR